MAIGAVAFQDTDDFPPPAANPALRVETNFLNRISVITPVQPFLEKNIPNFRTIACAPAQITCISTLSRPIEGRFAVVTDAGRDAVDADGAFDESA
jgi:hypothetical protein